VSWWDHGRCHGYGLVGAERSLGESGEGLCTQDVHKQEHARNHKNMNKKPRKPRTQKTPRCTQVRGLREEVKPLLLPCLSQYISVVLRYKVLLELYDATKVRTRDRRWNYEGGNELGFLPSSSLEVEMPHIYTGRSTFLPLPTTDNGMAKR